MSRNRIRIDATTADQLLDGGGVSDDHLRLAAVLSAAASPGRPAELAGRAAALAGFRAAHQQPRSPKRRPSMIKTAVLKLLTVKAAAIATAVVGTGGVALAAGTGGLPNPLAEHRPSVAGSPTPRQHPSKPSRDPAGSPSPSLVGLCNAYAAKAAGGGAEHGKALDNPAFHALITAAGGREKVDGFCATVVAASSASKTNHSGGAATDPSGKPRTEEPSATPSDRQKDNHPSGRPSRSSR